MKTILSKINSYEVTITSAATVCIDNYEQGQLEEVNNWTNDKLSFICDENNIQDLIIENLKRYIENTLYLTYNSNYVGLDDNLDFIMYSALVDKDNVEVGQDETDLINKWKQDKVTLYNQDNFIYISINGYELSGQELIEIIKG